MGVGAVGVLVDDQGDGVEDAVGVEAGEDDGAGVLGFGALHRLADGNGREGKDGRLFADGAAVGDGTEGVHLEMHIVGEAEGFQEPEPSTWLTLPFFSRHRICRGVLV